MLTLQFTEKYPIKLPVVRFVSNVFHPNNMY
jgi:ubiquitin-protein ligase